MRLARSRTVRSPRSSLESPTEFIAMNGLSPLSLQLWIERAKYFFARAAFAEEQDGRIAGGCFSGQFDRLFHLDACTDNQLITFSYLL